MGTIAIDTVPDDVLARLRQFAERHGSDLHAEALRCLEKGLAERELVEAELAELRALRERTKGVWLTDEAIRAARSEGRA